MSFISIPESWLYVGKALKKELFDRFNSNLEDLKVRVDALSVSSGPAIVFNEEIYNISSSLNLDGVQYFKAFANIQITKAQLQIFTKDGVASGALTFDLKKASTLGGAYTSVFSTKPSINYGAAVDYQSADGVFNEGQSVLQNEIIRFDITSVPPGVVIKKARFLVYGVLS